MNSKILFIDIETSPNIAYVWRFFKEFVGQDQILKTSEILSFAVKWLGEDEVTYVSRYTINPEKPFSKKVEVKLLKEINKYLDEADFVVAHNGVKFDIPRIRSRSLVLGIAPPSPYHIIDTYQIAAREFGFEKNSLEHLCVELGVVAKGKHKKYPGFELWREVMLNNEEAWDEMELYNIQDVLALEALYLSFRPWMKRHPVTVKEFHSEITCPKCGSTSNQSRGSYHTNIGKYRRYRCNSCGGWHRARYTERSIEENRLITVSI
jgi:uncharacterized protein YprB with RNaseH-like and TPR domain